MWAVDSQWEVPQQQQRSMLANHVPPCSTCDTTEQRQPKHPASSMRGRSSSVIGTNLVC